MLITSTPLNQSGVVSEDDEQESHKSETWNFAGSDDDNILMTSYLEHNIQPLQPSQQQQRDGGGVLILDGESASSDHLSYPESVPTEIDAIMDNHEASDDTLQQHKKPTGRDILLTLLLLLLIPTTSYLCWDRVHLMQQQEATLTRNQHLEQLVKDLELQVLASTRSPPDWKNSDDNSKEKIRLADNCWFKADLEFGDCLLEAKESWEDVAMDATKTLKDLFSGTTVKPDKAVEHPDTPPLAVQEASLMWDSAAVLESLMSFGKTLDESVLQAVEQSRDAIWDATDFLRDL